MNEESGEAGCGECDHDVEQVKSLIAKKRRNNIRNTEIPPTFDQAVKEKVWKDAMKKELSNITQRNVWEEIDLKDLKPDKKSLGTRWVYTKKYSSNYKARLVVLGCYQTPGKDYAETFSPVASDTTIRMVLCVANYKGWDIEQIDVETAFLNADLKEEVYIKVPKGYKLLGKGQIKDKVLKLNKALYGLVQAPRAWITEVSKVLSELGFIKSWVDPCLLIMKKNTKVNVTVIYVDDCIITGEPDKVKATIIQLEKHYRIKRLGKAKKYLGYYITRDKEKGTLKIDQTTYIKSFGETYKVEKANIKTPEKQTSNETGDLNILNPDVYRSGVGSLLYAAANYPS